MLRDDWKFPYRAGQLRDAAKEKVAFYEGRVKYWEGKKSEVLAQIKADGIEVEESVAADDKAYFSNSSRGPVVTVRNDLAEDLRECHNKLAKHRGNVAIYDGWLQMLDGRPADEVLHLERDDWLFFFSKKS